MDRKCQESASMLLARTVNAHEEADPVPKGQEAN